MLDDKLNPHLIEYNYLPSFRTDAPVDLHVKKPLIRDTLNLVRITEDEKLNFKKLDNYYTQERRK